MTELIAPPDPSLSLEGPGTRLHQAREARKWSVGDVAARLHLDPRQVVALEADDFSHLPEPIYVSGYLRSYARLMNLPEQDVVAAYQRLYSPPAPPVLSQAGPRRDPSAYQAILQWGAVAVVGAGLLVVGWHMHETPGAGATAAPDTVATPSHGPALAGAAVGTALAADPAPVVAPSRDPVPGAPAAAAAASVPPAAATAAAKRAPAPPLSAVRVSTPADGAPATATPVSAAPAAEAGPEPAAIDAGAELQLHFTDSSWVEIQDATGQRVFYDLGQAGQTRTIHGAPPFKVLLGYSPGVSIDYNGAPFDKSPYAGHNNVARFTIGG